MCLLTYLAIYLPIYLSTILHHPSTYLSTDPSTCHRFCNCYKNLTFCSLWARFAIPCAYHAKPHRQKWSVHAVLCAFSLGNVLRATTACKFACLIWRHGSAPAALASLLFDPAEPQIIRKTQWIATFPPFRAPASSFFALFLFSHLLTASLLLSHSSPPLLFNPSILSEVWLLNFLQSGTVYVCIDIVVYLIYDSTTACNSNTSDAVLRSASTTIRSRGFEGWSATERTSTCKDIQQFPQLWNSRTH